MDDWSLDGEIIAIMVILFLQEMTNNISFTKSVSDITRMMYKQHI